MSTVDLQAPPAWESPPDRAPALRFVRRIRERLAALSFAGAPDLRCTVSLGAAGADREMTAVDAWVREADAALCRAKAAGRDRFVGTRPLRSAQA